MATTKKSTPTASKSGEASTHSDVDALTSSAVADPHATAFAERQRDPSRYDNPTIATPGVLEDVDEDAGKPTALVDADAPSDLDPSVDNRDQVQPMLDTLAASVEDDATQAVAAINAHESDAVDVEALTAEQDAKREEAREATAASREEARTAAATPDSKK